MLALKIILLSLYVLALLFTTIYGLAHARLAWLYKHGKQSLPPPNFGPEALPFVTVQLPVYNERYVIERLIGAVSRFDYPKDRFEIQVLDDSTDDTTEIIRREMSRLGTRGFNVTHVQRNDRKGFKAGALKHGKDLARGEFIAIFDADFVPLPDFLLQTIPYFADKETAMVQARWAHLNEDYSPLAMLLGFALDAHFSVEQGGRFAAGYFINFNGTAGVWRKAAIDDAGGWEADTLTEDLDLSYRAQLKGWSLRFAEDIIAPAELPVTIGAIKSQQYRWTKGAAECSRKNLARVFASPLPWPTKFHAAIHLLGCIMPLCIAFCSFSSVVIVYFFGEELSKTQYVNIAAIFAVGLLALLYSYWTAYSSRHTVSSIWDVGGFFGKFFGFMAIYIGLSPMLALGTIEGLMGVKTPFVRTPKLNIVDRSDGWSSKLDYARLALNPPMVVEALGAAFFAFGAVVAASLSIYVMAIFFALVCAGFLAVTFYNIYHAVVFT